MNIERCGWCAFEAEVDPDIGKDASGDVVCGTCGYSYKVKWAKGRRTWERNKDKERVDVRARADAKHA